MFRADGGRSAIEGGFEAALEHDLGFEVTTFVRTVGELRRILTADPFPTAPGDTYFVTFLKERLSPSKARALEALSNDFDTLVVDGRNVHWRMRGRSTETTLSSKRWAGVVGPRRSTSCNVTMLPPAHGQDRVTQTGHRVTGSVS